MHDPLNWILFFLIAAFITLAVQIARSGRTAAVAPKTVPLDADAFLSKLRESGPETLSISAHGLTTPEERYRFWFRDDSDDGPVIYETGQPPYAVPLSRDTPYNLLMRTLLGSAKWISDCTQHCEWCGWCVNVVESKGWVDHPASLLPDPGPRDKRQRPLDAP